MVASSISPIKCNKMKDDILMTCGLILQYFSVCCSGDVRPIYTTKNFWHGSDKNGTRTQKSGSARINFAV